MRPREWCVGRRERGSSQDIDRKRERSYSVKPRGVSHRVTRRQFLKSAAVAAGAAALLQGCRPASTLVPSTATAKPAASPVATLSPTSAGPTAAAVRKRGGTLRIAVEEFWRDGWLIRDGFLCSGPQQPAFEHLLYFDGDDPYKLTPGLAEAWTVKDMREWTFRIREGVRWHGDYGEVTAEDIAWTYDLIAREDAKHPDATYLRSRVGGMRVVDSHTLTFAFDNIDPDLGYLLSPWRGSVINCKKYVEAVGEDQADREGIGSGPYRPLSQVPNSQIEYGAVDWPHWRVDPKWDRMVIMNIPEDPTRLAMLDTGRADLIVVTAEQLSDAQERGLTLYPSITQAMVCIMFGGLFMPGHPEYTGKDPWQDVRVREAMNIAIDREAINKTFFASLGTYEPVQGNHVAPLSATAHMPTPYDPDRARSLLSAARATGMEAPVFSYGYPGIPQLPQIVEAVAGYWEAVGIKPKIIPIDRMKFRNDHWIADKTNGMMWPWANTTLPLYQSRFEKFYYSKNIGFQIYTDEYLDRVYEELILTGDAVKRDQMLADAQVHMAEQWGAVHILNVPAMVYAGNPKTVGTWGPLGTGDTRNFEYVSPA